MSGLREEWESGALFIDLGGTRDGRGFGGGKMMNSWH